TSTPPAAQVPSVQRGLARQEGGWDKDATVPETLRERDARHRDHRDRFSRWSSTPRPDACCRDTGRAGIRTDQWRSAEDYRPRSGGPPRAAARRRPLRWDRLCLKLARCNRPSDTPRSRADNPDASDSEEGTRSALRAYSQ